MCDKGYKVLYLNFYVNCLFLKGILFCSRSRRRLATKLGFGDDWTGFSVRDPSIYEPTFGVSKNSFNMMLKNMINSPVNLST